MCRRRRGGDEDLTGLRPSRTRLIYSYVSLAMARLPVGRRGRIIQRLLCRGSPCSGNISCPSLSPDRSHPKCSPSPPPIPWRHTRTTATAGPQLNVLAKTTSLTTAAGRTALLARPLTRRLTLQPTRPRSEIGSGHCPVESAEGTLTSTCTIIAAGLSAIYPTDRLKLKVSRGRSLNPSPHSAHIPASVTASFHASHAAREDALRSVRTAPSLAARVAGTAGASSPWHNLLIWLFPQIHPREHRATS